MSKAGSWRGGLVCSLAVPRDRAAAPQPCPAHELLSAAPAPELAFQNVPCSLNSTPGLTKHESESYKEKRVCGSTDLTSSHLHLEEDVVLLVLACS